MHCESLLEKNKMCRFPKLLTLETSGRCPAAEVAVAASESDLLGLKPTVTNFVTLGKLLKVSVHKYLHYTMGMMIESACCED